MGPMLLNLLALGVGMTQGKAEVAMAARERAAEEEKQRLINEGAAEKERIKAQGETEKAAAKAKATELGKAEADILKQKAEVEARRQSYGHYVDLTSRGAPSQLAAEISQWENYDADALAEFRLPMADPETGGFVIDSVTNKPKMFPRFVSNSTESGAAGATNEFESLVSQFDNGNLQWWKQNDQAQYDKFTDLLARTVRIQAGGTETPNVTGQTAAVPVILPSTLLRLSNRFSPEYAMTIAKTALAGTGTGEEAIREMYPRAFQGLALAADAKIEEKVIDTPDGPAVVQTAPEGGGWIEGFDIMEGDKPILFKEGRRHIRKAAAALNIGPGKFEARVSSFAQVKAEQTNNPEITPGALMYDIYMLRSQFSGEAMGDDPSEEPAYNQPGSFLFYDVTKSQDDVDSVRDFIARYGMFSPGSDYNVDLGILASLAPVGISMQYPRLDGQDNRSVFEGGSVKTAQIKQKPFYVDRITEHDEYFRAKYEKVLGGKIESYRDKGLAAGAGLVTLDALIYLGEQTQIPIPVGLAASGIKTVNSWSAQIQGIIDVVDAIDLSPENRDFVRDRLTKTKRGLDGTDVGGMTLSDVASAIAARDYYEGVLVYSMAMALQGGNAAARTISDADITRIREILSVASDAGPEQRKAIYQLLRPMLDRQKALTDAVVAGGEAGAWAAITFNNMQGRIDMARQELDQIILKAYEIRGIRRPGSQDGEVVPQKQTCPPGFEYDEARKACVPTSAVS